MVGPTWLGPDLRVLFLACSWGTEQQVWHPCLLLHRQHLLKRPLVRLTPGRIWVLVLADIISVRSIDLTTKLNDSMSRLRQQTCYHVCVNGSHPNLADRCWPLTIRLMLWTPVIAACFCQVRCADSVHDGFSGPGLRTTACSSRIHCCPRRPRLSRNPFSFLSRA